MSFFGKIFDIFGNGGNNKFYARDFRNAYTLRPDINPPRQKFQGYVNFIVNRDLYGESWYNDNASFRTQLSSLVRTATLPEVEFKTETKNQYNRKRIVNTGLEYQPVDIKVMDTINNEWLILFMKYYSYHYMNPRNKQGDRPNRNDVNNGVGIDFGGRSKVEGNAGSQNVGSEFGLDTTSWSSNSYGFNLNLTSTFFERIDYVIYHGNKAVQYSLYNPTLTRFRTGEIDYSSSELMEFDMTFEYESFNVYQNVNFGLSEEDVLRFENGRNFTGPAFVPLGVPVVLENERTMEFLGESPRSGQPQPKTPPGDDSTNPSSANAVNGSDLQSDKAPKGSDVVSVDPITGLPTLPAVQVKGNKLVDVYGNAAKFATPTSQEKGFLEGLLGNVADQALTAAIHGKSVKNAVLSTAVGGVVSGITSQIKTPVRGPKPQGPGGGG
jgi:hypothetical protein